MYDFSAKDALATGNPDKLIKGSEVDDELDAIVTANATKFDSSDIASQTQAEAGSLNTVLMTPLRVQQWADDHAGAVGDLQALTDPGGDRALFWDNSDGALEWTDSLPDSVLSSNVALKSISGSAWTSRHTMQGGLVLEGGTNGSAYRFTVTNDSDTRFFNFQDSADNLIGGLSLQNLDGAGAGRVSAVGDWDFPGNVTIGGGQSISDSDNVALLDQSNVFTGTEQTLSGTSPRLSLIETDRGTDEKNWWIHLFNGEFRLRTRTDADGIGEDALRIERTGTTVDTINFPDGELQYGGREVGFREMLVNEQNSNYTTDADDSHGLIYKDSGGAGETITVDGSDYSTGAVISFVNNGGGDLTIAMSDDTLIQAGTGSTGSRTLTDHGMATAVKVDGSNWFISGTGLS